MPLERNIISKELNRIKDRHGLTHESWAQKSSVPVGTISRYLGYNCGVPNYMHLCAMLDCVGEDIKAFYRLITGAADRAPNVPAAVPESIPMDPQKDVTLLRSMQERVTEQSETMLGYLSELHEQDAQLRELRAEMRGYEKTISEREKRIADINADLKIEREEAARQRKRNHVLFIAVLCLLVVFIALAIVYIWDVSNLHKGMTSWLHPELQ